ncbi:DUF6286 domain-containing protein [Streptomyces sp. ACA25]|uniref:DUF6286 domain-containing protein n=1 Tax=Streptomyces sp. ACA25 TaxID=3022596 RepID=UPI0023082E18|nr:DUF6286 domain-containing protein [Streptomyces sp. ACA25]MDB1088427.1 DUF6286 domain-containing protein [Streptomyces sp. ACA25]
MSHPTGEPGEPSTGPPTLEKKPSGATAAPLPGGGPGGGDEPGTTGRDQPAARAEDGAARRFWSSRRVPAGIVALVLLAATALLLYDVVAVRADRPAGRWRTNLADALATRQLDDPWVVAGAVLAVLLGIWLLVLALTPGLRGLLPMRTENDTHRAGLHRSAAALILRDRAMEVSGVRSARVTVGRRRVRATAQVHFRDLDEVRSDLDAALHSGLDELGLARRPSLALHVRRPAKG